jgi:hypothetical protein
VTKFSNSQRSALPVLVSARDAPSLPFPSGHSRRGRSAGRRNVFDSCLAAASLWRRGSRRPALHRRRSLGEPFGRLQVPRSALPGTRPRRRLTAPSSPSPASSSQSGLNAARSGPGASRVFACEAKPRAPRHRRVAPYGSGHWRSCRRLSPDGPTTRTPLDGALRRTGRIAYSPS